MLTNVLPWLTRRHLVIWAVAAALTISMAFAAIGNSWTANAAPAEPSEVVADEDMTLAGPSWTLFTRAEQPPVDFFGPSWG